MTTHTIQNSHQIRSEITYPQWTSRAGKLDLTNFSDAQAFVQKTVDLNCDTLIRTQEFHAAAKQDIRTQTANPDGHLGTAVRDLPATQALASAIANHLAASAHIPNFWQNNCQLHVSSTIADHLVGKFNSSALPVEDTSPTYVSEDTLEISHQDDRGAIPHFLIDGAKAGHEMELRDGKTVRFPVDFGPEHTLTLTALVRKVIERGGYMSLGRDGYQFTETISPSAIIKDLRGQRNRGEGASNPGGAEIAKHHEKTLELAQWHCLVDGQEKKIIDSYDPKTKQVQFSAWFTNFYRATSVDNELEHIKFFSWSAFKKTRTLQFILDDKSLSHHATIKHSADNSTHRRLNKLPSVETLKTGNRSHRKQNAASKRRALRMQFAPLTKTNDSNIQTWQQSDSCLLVTQSRPSEARRPDVIELHRSTEWARSIIEPLLQPGKISVTSDLSKSLYETLKTQVKTYGLLIDINEAMTFTQLHQAAHDVAVQIHTHSQQLADPPDPRQAA